MQLKKKYKNISKFIATASCVALGANVHADEKETEAEWQFEASILYYSESDRVTAIEPVVRASKEEADKTTSVKLVIDSLTGASASGAVAAPSVQTFTRPSGNGEYQVNSNETPLDDTFHDTRVALSFDQSVVLNEDYSVQYGAQVSKEYDYQSIGLSGGFSRDFYDGNTTLSMGLSAQFDESSPVGDVPIGFSQMAIRKDFATETEFEQAWQATRLKNSDSKTTVDFLFGVTQVINQNTIMQFNLSHGEIDGYQTDPYKIFSRVDADGLPIAHYYEQRPDKRSKTSFYWRTKTKFTDDILDVSYRYYTDDWGIKSHTVTAGYRFPVGEQTYFEPQIRWFTQSAADFYRHSVNENEDLSGLTEISADYRLADMDTITIGAKWTFELEDEQSWSMRVAYYQQTGDSHPSDAVGQLQTQDLFPTQKAVMLQFSYDF